MADEDVKIVIKQKGTIPVYTKTKVGVAEVHHDESLEGKGTVADPLKVSEKIIVDIDSRVEKTDEADKVYGTDANGDQTTYDLDSFGKVDDVLVDGESVVEDKIASIDLTGKVDKTSEADKIYGTDSLGEQTVYDKDSFGKVDDVRVDGVSVVENKIADIDLTGKQDVLTPGRDIAITKYPVVLPEGYTLLEYIESTGTQYIDTGYAPTSNTNSMKAQIKHSYLSYKTEQNKNPFMFGSSTLVGDLRCYNRIGLLSNNFVYTITRDVSREIDTGVSPVLGTVYDTEYSINFGTSASLKILNGSTVVVNDTQTGNMQRSTETYYLFAINHNVEVDGIRETIGRIYSCKIYENELLVCDFIPCKNENDVVGMYDLISETFFGNAGTGVFVAGPLIPTNPVINFTNASGYAKKTYVDTELANKQDKLTAGANITISGTTISATDTTYEAGDNITINNNIISATDTTYEAGTGIEISNGQISTDNIIWRKW